MPEAARASVGLLDQPLRVVGSTSPAGFPAEWSLRQVVMPDRPGVDALAAAPTWGGSDDVVAAAVRHWCGEDLGQLEVRSATTSTVQDEGPVLGLDALVLHDPALHDVAGCPLVRIDRDTALLWARGTRHRRGSRRVDGWVPYGQTVVRWLDRDPTQPVAHTMAMAGLGAATSFDGAVELACRDVVAQAAVMDWWLHDVDAVPDVVEATGDLRRAWDGSPLELRLRALPSDVAPVLLAVVVDPKHGLATLGAAAGPDAAREAASRALWQLTVARDLVDQHGVLGPHVNPGLLPRRPERDYLAAAGPGLTSATDPFSAVQLGLDPAVVEHVLARTDGRDLVGGEAAAGRGAPVGASLDALLAAGHDVWVVDLTTPDVAAAGWHGVRVLVPGLARIPVPAFGLDLRSRERLPYPGW